MVIFSIELCGIRHSTGNVFLYKQFRKTIYSFRFIISYDINIIEFAFPMSRGMKIEPIMASEFFHISF